MKNLILVAALLSSTYAFSCSCEEIDYATPSINSMTSKLVKRVFNAEIGEATMIKYYPSLFERTFAPKPSERNGGNCWDNSPQNRPIHGCQLSRKAIFKVEIPELGCQAIIKAKRNSRKTKAKLISHNCEL